MKVFLLSCLIVKRSQKLCHVQLSLCWLWPGVVVKMHSPKKVSPSTYFQGNKYSPVYISQVKITPGITVFLGNNKSFGKKSTPLHGHNFLHIIFSHGLERVFQYLNLATRETVHSIVTFPNRIFVTRVRLIYDILLFWSKHLTINLW